MEGSSHHHRIGVDIGGTFTDLVVFDDVTGSFAVGKTLTTPRDPSQAVETLVLETLKREGIAASEARPGMSSLRTPSTLAPESSAREAISSTMP